MINLAIVAHDPGGANLLYPIIEFLLKENEFSIALMLLGPAKRILKFTSEKLITISLDYYTNSKPSNTEFVSESEVNKIFKTNKIDVVFTATSFQSNLEKLAIKISKELDIPSFSIIDAWSNYRQRFNLEYQSYFPDYLYILDEQMKRDVVSSDINSHLIVTGNPYLQKIRNRFFRKRDLNKIETSGKIRFFSDNFWYYYPDYKLNEFIILENLCNTIIDNNINARILIKPHPLENIKIWEDFVNKKGDKIFSIDNSNFEEYILEDFISIGISTVALLSTSVAGLPTFSYQIGFDLKNYFYIPFKEYGIRIIENNNDLINMLNYKYDYTNLDMQFTNPLNVIADTLKKYCN